MKGVSYQKVKVGDMNQLGKMAGTAPLEKAYNKSAPILQEHPSVLTQPENTHKVEGIPTQYTVDLKR